MDLSDERILAIVQAGDREAYLHLFERYYARIEGYARKRLGNAEAARDIASETFLRAYRAVDHFRTGEIAYLSYLIMICRRLIISEQSRPRPAALLSWEEAVVHGDLLDEGAERPVDRVLKQEQRAVMQAALDCLPAQDREIVLLAFERDLSRKEIAMILDKPTVTAVTSHLHRAMQKLKTILTEQGYFAASAL
jgi:RNA polymerase sigma-70 factor (ECF subfamily)